jgi:hypothetical protein
MAYVPPALANVGVSNSPLAILATDAIAAALAVERAIAAFQAEPRNAIRRMALKNATASARSFVENLGAAIADPALTDAQRQTLQEASTRAEGVVAAAQAALPSVFEPEDEGDVLPGPAALAAAAAEGANYVSMNNGGNEPAAGNNIPVAFIKEYVKQTKVPLMYDLERCELVVSADRKGVMKGYLEARAPSLQLLSDQVKRLTREEYGLRGAKSAVKTRRAELKSAKNTSRVSLSDYGTLKNKLDSVVKKKETYRACMVQGTRNMYGVPCVDRFREYERQEAELRPQVVAAEQSTMQWMGNVSSAEAQKQQAKATLAATRAAAPIKPSKGLFGFASRGGTRRRRAERRGAPKAPRTSTRRNRH